MKDVARAAIVRAIELTREAWIIAGITLALLLVMEGCSYLVVKALALDKPVMGFRSRAEGYIGKVDPIKLTLEMSRTDVRWWPYSYWRGGVFSGEYVTINPYGLRRTVNPPGPGLRPNVFMFGGSSMWGFGASDEYTIPSQVSSILHKKYGIAANVVNYAQLGFVSSQSLLELLGELRGKRRPNVVVFLDGANEIVTTVVNDNIGLTPNEGNRRREFNLLNTSRAAFLRMEALYGLVANSYTYTLLKAARQQGPTAAEQQSQAAGENWEGMARSYEFNVSAVDSISQRFRFKPLFYWQPFIFGKKRLTKYEELAAGYYAYIRPATEEARTSLARRDFGAAGIMFTDLSDLFADSSGPMFMDWCHYSEMGNRVIAEVMADDIAVEIKRQIAAAQSCKEAGDEGGCKYASPDTGGE
ncbi:MAG: hypothetical protein OEZ04_09580 [Nitrospinota bacterium]|nr:hypothetical protein [Nitrospinota bacterium]